MTSTVLARKHRPRDFAGMVGQEHVVRALSNALTQGRLHHAYLFTGTRGVGKTTVSRILAKSLNCVGPDRTGGITATPCGRCEACTAIDAGRFVDYVELDAASNRGVEEITTLLDQSVYKPVLGRFKVYMIDEVHMLTNHAFNAMLKTLEEPPDYLKFVLATTDPQKVPPTVLSRCLQFNLRPMAPPTVQEHLAHVLAEEGVAFDVGALRLLSRAARGSMRDALSLTDQAIAFGGGALREDAVRGMLGAVDRSRAVGLLDALRRGDGASLVEQVDALRRDGHAAAAAADEMVALLQRMAIAQVAPGALEAEDPDEQAAVALADGWPADELQLAYSLILNGQPELALAPDEHAGLLMLLLRALAFRPDGAAVDAPVRPPPPARRPVDPPPPPVAAPAPTPTSVAPWDDEPAPPPVERARPAVMASAASSVQVPVPVTPPTRIAPSDADADADADADVVPVSVPTDASTRWSAWVQALSDQGAVQALVRELALQAQCLAIDATPTRADIRLRVEREPLRAPGLVDKLRGALANWLGHAVAIEVEAGPVDDSPALQAARRREQRQQEAERAIHDDPLVRELMQQFATARIVPGSIKPH